MQVYLATFYNESNAFAPLPTSVEDFEPMDMTRPGSESFEAAFAPVFAAGGLVSGTFNKAALPGGLVTQRCYETLRDTLLAELRENLPVDLVLLNLHGAMAADGYPDCEGDLLTRVRALVGEVPIVVPLDPHSHVTRAMCEAADLLLTYKEYPHVDEAATLARAVELGLAILGGAKPILTWRDPRQIAIYHTTREPMRGLVARMREWETEDGVLSVSLVHGFAWGDVPELGTKVLVYTDGAATTGAAIADALCLDVQSMRGSANIEVVDYVGAFSALERTGRPILFADTADNPGGGAPGDSTFLLAELLKSRARPAAFGPLWDPQSVQIARKAGAGARLFLRLGGKTSPASGEPLDLFAEVRAFEDHLQTPGVGGYEIDYGPAALLRVDGVDIVVTSKREQAMDPAMFTRLGASLSDKAVILVKSSQHFHAAYAPLASRIVHVGSPGALNLDFASIPYRHVCRPIWPLDR